MTSTANNPTGWQHRPERSNMLMLRLMTWISLRLGRPAGRVVLHLIAAYFLLFAPASRAASRSYLARVLAHPVRLADIYRHFFCFASTVHDRIYLLNQRFDLFDIEVHGEQSLIEALQGGTGVFLLGSHVGSFEVTRAVGWQRGGLPVAVAVFEENARKLNQVLAAINPAAQQEVIKLGKIDSMLQVSERLDQGTLVGMLGDRSFGADVMVPVQLLGGEAHLPQGPFRMAAILRRPVFFMVGLYLGENRYRVHFQQLADFAQVERGQRQQEIERSIARYAELLETHCRSAPYNWFNFYDFWQPSAPATRAADAVETRTNR